MLERLGKCSGFLAIVLMEAIRIECDLFINFVLALDINQFHHDVHPHRMNMISICRVNYCDVVIEKMKMEQLVMQLSLGHYSFLFV